MWNSVSKIVMTAVVVIIVVLHIATRVKAKKHGILCAKLPTGSAAFWLLILCTGVQAWLCVSGFLTYREYIGYINDMETRGIEAVADHENTTAKELLSGVAVIGDKSYEEIYVEREIEHYRSLADDYKERSISLTFSTVGFLAALSTTVIYFTKDGVMFWCVFKPQRFTAKAEGSKLLLRMEKSPQKTFMRLRGSRKNKERFSEFILPEADLY